MSLRHFIKQLPRNSFLLRTFTSVASLGPQSRPSTQTQQQQQNPPTQLKDPHSLLKEDPIQICSDLWYKTFSSPTTTNPITNLTGFLKKFDLWVLAYQRSCAEETGSFPPRNAIHLNILRDILSLQSAVLNGKFVWGIKTEVFLRSPNDKPLLKLSRRKVQEILESGLCKQTGTIQSLVCCFLRLYETGRHRNNSYIPCCMPIVDRFIPSKNYRSWGPTLLMLEPRRIPDLSHCGQVYAIQKLHVVETCMIDIGADVYSQHGGWGKPLITCSPNDSLKGICIAIVS